MTEHARFLTDEPDQLGTDAFGHSDYAEALHSIVTDERPPLTVGLFGPWGVGKSSIIGALQKKLTGDTKTAFVYFDAWRYEEDPLRRQFLLDVATDLSKDDRLKDYDLEEELWELEFDTQGVRESLGFSRARVLRMLLVGLLFGAVAAAVLLLVGLQPLTEGQVGKKVLAGLIVAAAGVLGGALSQAISIDAKTMTRKSLADPDRFARKFAELLKALKPPRLVIAIDNLDRSSPEKAVEILATIKTYLEPTVSPEAFPRPSGRPTVDKKIVFVIAVDDEALRRHLIAKEEERRAGSDGEAASRYVEEYLAKFFGARLPIREILGDDMRDYVAGYMEPLAEARGLEEPETRDLVTVVNAGLRGNPRAVKQFHNDLEVRLRLFEERESERENGRPGISPPVSGEVAMVAKLALIEREWPAAFARLQADPLLLDSWLIWARESGLVDWNRDRVQGAPPPGLGPPTPGQGEQRRLATFLRVSSRVQSARLRTMLSLRQARFEIELPSYPDFREALIADDRERTAELLEAAPAEERDRLATRVSGILEEELSRGYLDAGRSILDVVCASEAFADDDKVRRETIRVAAEEPLLRAEVADLDPVAVLRAGELLEPDARRELFAPYLERYHDGERIDEERIAVGRALAPYVAELSVKQRSELQSAIQGDLHDQFDLYLPFLEAAPTLLAATGFDSALEALAAQRQEGPRPELPGPLHRRLPAATVVEIGLGTPLGESRAERVLGIAEGIFEGSVAAPEDLARDLVPLRDLVGSVEGDHPDHLAALARSFAENFGAIQEEQRTPMIEFAGEVLGRCPDQVADEVAPLITSALFDPPGSGVSAIGSLEVVPAAFRAPFLERLGTLVVSVEFWEAALELFARIDPDGFASRVLFALDQHLRGGQLEIVDQLLDRYSKVLAGVESLGETIVAALAARLAQGNPGPSGILERLAPMLGADEIDELGRLYAAELVGPHAPVIREALEGLSGKAEALGLAAAHQAVRRIDADAGRPPDPLLGIVARRIGRLPGEDQEYFAEQLAARIGGFPGQSPELAPALMEVEGLPAEWNLMLAEALLVAEPNLPDVESRAELLRAAWHLRKQRNSKVRKLLVARAAELEAGNGNVERELARRLRDWIAASPA